MNSSPESTVPAAPKDHPEKSARTTMIQILRLSLLLVMLPVAAYYGALHFSVLQIAHPISQDEPGFVEITAAGNAYTDEAVRACGNVYGPGYTIFARPFTRLISDDYIAHRWANTVALLAALGVLAWQLRRQGVGRVEIAAGLVIIYSLNVSSHSLAASADLLAAALCFFALVAGQRGTWPALLLGLAFSILGGLTKLYAAFGWVVVASHLIFFAPRTKALGFLAASALAALVCAVLLRFFAPGYFLSTFVVHWVASTPSFAVLRLQTAEFALLAGGLVGLAVWGWPFRWRFSLSRDGGLIRPAVDFWNWAALLATAVLLGKLGWHTGNYLVYYYHLLLLPLALVALRRIQHYPCVGRWLLIANLLVLGWQLPPLPGNDRWAALESDVAQTAGPVLAEAFFQPLVARHPKIELFQHGQTASILQSLDALGPAVPPAYAGVHRDLIGAVEAQNARINAEEFDAIYLSYEKLNQRVFTSYDRGRSTPSIEAHYTLVSEERFYPYGAPYWARLAHGRYPYIITKWLPHRLTKGAGKESSPPTRPSAP